MPTYEYACTSCAHEWEFEQSIEDDAAEGVPACHGQTAKRQISRGTGFILKGGGWYSDLYSSSEQTRASGSAEGGTGEPSRRLGVDARRRRAVPRLERAELRRLVGRQARARRRRPATPPSSSSADGLMSSGAGARGDQPARPRLGGCWVLRWRRDG